MPFIGIGLHLLVAIFFAVHAVRTGRDMYWLLLLFMFPLLGSVVYFFAVFLPESQLDRKVNRTVNAVARTLDPGRTLREAQAAFEMTPTAQNQMALANAMLESGDAAGAARHFESCLQGPFARDAQMRVGAARARLINGEGAAALQLLQAVREDNPSHAPEAMCLLLARAHDSVGNDAQAQAELRHCHEKFGGLEAKVEYAIWAHKKGQADLAAQLRAEIAKAVKHMPKHARKLNQPLLNRLQAQVHGKAGPL